MPPSTATARRTGPRQPAAAALPPGPSLRRALAVLAAVVVIVYANALATGLPLDAGALVLGNPALRAATWTNVRTILGSDYWSPMAVNGLYRPVTTLSFLLGWTLAGNGGSPAGHHLPNVLLHVGTAGAVLVLFRRLGLASLPALLGALLFAIHPVTTEVVTNVAGRADLLAAAFVLSGLLCHDRARRSAGLARLAWSGAVAASALLGACSKENAIVLLPLLVAWDAIVPPRAERWRERLRGPLLVAPGIAIALAAGWWVRRHGFPPEAAALDNPILAAPFWPGRVTALGVLAAQVGTLLWPLRLRADYSFDQIPLAAWPPEAGDALRALLGIAVLVVPALLAIRSWRRRPALAFCCVWWVLTLLPTANLLLVIGSIRAERFLYLPLVGAAGAVASLAWGAAPAGTRRRRAVVAAAAVVLVLFAVRTVARNRDWRDDLTLWEATVAISPRNAKAHNGLGEAIAARNAPGTLPRAIEETRAALAIRPDYLQALVNLAAYELAAGDALGSTRPAEAQAHYRTALATLRRALPLDREAAARFRRAMRARGHAGRAIPDYGNRPLYRTLIQVRARLGRLHGALAAARRLQQLDPWDPQAYVDTAAVLYRLGRRDEAAIALHEALLAGAGGDVPGRLLAVYRASGADAAVPAADGGLRLDASAGSFRRDRCAALRALAAGFDDAALPERAAALRAEAGEACGAG